MTGFQLEPLLASAYILLLILISAALEWMAATLTSGQISITRADFAFIGTAILGSVLKVWRSFARKWTMSTA